MPRFARTQRQQPATAAPTGQHNNKSRNLYSNAKLATLFTLCVIVAFISDTYRNRPQTFTELKRGNIAALWQTKQNAKVAVDPLRRPVDDYAAQVHTYFEGENFAVLEKLVAQLRTTKQRLTGGEWKLAAFYQGLRPSSAEKEDPVRWRANLNRLGKWAKQFPNSATPLIAMVDNFAEFAEPIKTKEELENLPTSKRQLLKEGIETSQIAIETAQASQTKDPHLYASMLELGKLANWDRSKFEQLYQAGVELEPTYQHLHQAKATYLLPTWNGRLGESEQFVQQLAENTGGQTGQQLYYLVATHATEKIPDNATDQVRFSLGSIKEGFKSLESTYGVDTKTLNTQGRILARQGDLAGAQTMFDRIGSNYEPSVWRSKSEFSSMQATASQTQGNDLGAFGNFNTLLVAAYGVSLLLSRSYLGELAGPVTNALTVGTLTGVSANLNQQEQLNELIRYTKETIQQLADIIDRASR